MRNGNPFFKNRCTRCDPIKPAPTVTSTLIPEFSPLDLGCKIGWDFGLPHEESFARPSEYLTCGLYKNLYVQHRSPTTDVVQIEFHPLVEILYIVPAVNLPETSYAWLHHELLLLIFSKTGILTNKRRSGTHQTHVPFY